MSSPYGARSRARRRDRARVVLAIILIVFTALVGMLGAAPAVKGQEVPVPAADRSDGLRLAAVISLGKGS